MSAIIVKVARQKTPRKSGFYPLERLHRGLRAQRLTRRSKMLVFGARLRFASLAATPLPARIRAWKMHFEKQCAVISGGQTNGDQKSDGQKRQCHA